MKWFLGFVAAVFVADRLVDWGFKFGFKEGRKSLEAEVDEYVESVAREMGILNSEMVRRGRRLVAVPLPPHNSN